MLMLSSWYRLYAKQRKFWSIPYFKLMKFINVLSYDDEENVQEINEIDVKLLLLYIKLYP